MKLFKVIQKRKDLHLNQTDFWARVGVNKNQGCKYENGHSIPKTTRLLLHLTYGKQPLRALAEMRGTTVDELRRIGL